MVLLKLPGEAVVCGETVWRGLTIMDGGWWVAGDGAHFSQRRRRRRIIAFCACISSRDDSSGIGEPRGLPRSAGRAKLQTVRTLVAELWEAVFTASAQFAKKKGVRAEPYTVWR